MRPVVAPVAMGSWEFDALDVLSVRFGGRKGEVWIHTTGGHLISVYDQTRDEVVSTLNAARWDAWFEEPWQPEAPEELT